MFWKFKDERQQAQVMQTLLNRTGLVFADGVFAVDQPTEKFWELLAARRMLSHGEQIILNIALDLWRGEGQVRLADLFFLDAELRALVLSLLQAMSEGQPGIQRWLRSQPITNRN